MLKYIFFVCSLFFFNAIFFAQNLTSGEYFFDQDGGIGNGIPFNFESKAEVIGSIEVDVSSLTPGFHFLFTRVKNTTGIWSHYEGRAFYILEKSTVPEFEPQPNLVKGEWFIDNDPGTGKGFAFNFSPNTSITTAFEADLTNFTNGFHQLFVRVVTENGKWSHYEGRMFYIVEPSNYTMSETQPMLSTAEFFIDVDPGVGKAKPIVMTSSDSFAMVADLDITNISEGMHTLSLRVKNTKGKWSLYEQRNFYVINQSTIPPLTSSKLKAYEWFVDNDPGFGKGNKLSRKISDTLVEVIDLSVLNLSDGEHKIFIRVQNTLNQWSLIEVRKFNICSTVLPNPEIVSSPSACAGSTITLTGKAVTGAVSYLWKGPNNFTATGLTASISNSDINHTGKYTFYAVRNGGTSCDTSNSEVAVTVMPVQRKSNPQTICKGGFYEINGKKYVSAGTYEDILKSKNGCDSIITTTLKVNEPSTFKEVKHICQGETYKGYSTTGVYSKKLTNSVGCDSTYTLDLIVHAPVKKVENKTICIGETYKGKTKTGSYTFSFTTSYGCDSTEQLNLIVRSKDTTAFSKSICKGQTYEGKSTSGVYYLNKKSVYGCDSIVKLILNVNNPSSSSETKHICEGASYKGYTKTGTYTQKLVNKLGCDSVYTLQLIVHAPIKKVEKKTVCYGSTYKGQTKTGTYYFNYKTSYGCDSIEQLDLEVLTRDTTVLTKTICKGEKYDGYGEAGSYIYKKKNSLGCDSVVSLTLNVRALPKVSLTFRETLCSNTGVFQLDSLNAGIPKGGIFTGDHVQEDNVFDPKGLSGAVALTYTYTDDFGCASSITKSVQLSEANGTASCKVGAVSSVALSRLRIYPNPTSDVIRIEQNNEHTLNKYTLKITDLVGKELYLTSIELQHTEISLKKLGAVGVYLVQLYNDKGGFVDCQRVVLND